MSEPVYVFDAAAWDTRSDALNELVTTLPLPMHTGHNLDALADALWEIPACSIVLIHANALSESGSLGRWGVALRQVLLDTAHSCRSLSVTLFPLGR